MSDSPPHTQRGKMSFLFILILIACGSALLLFPAWLPTYQYKVLGEDGIVEMLQVILLILSSALYFAASAHAGILKPIFFALGLGGLATAIGECSRPLEQLIPHMEADWLVIPLLAGALWRFLRHPKAFSRFWSYASKTPAAGFMLAGIILAYVFGEFFGSQQFWAASLGEQINSDIPHIVESYLELLACYFIFISTLGFCLPITKRSGRQLK